jgi:hypothetical protein
MKSLFIQRGKSNRDIASTVFAPGGKDGYCVLQTGIFTVKDLTIRKKRGKFNLNNPPITIEKSRFLFRIQSYNLQFDELLYQSVVFSLFILFGLMISESNPILLISNSIAEICPKPECLSGI